jgi:hypothetical protein
MSEGLFESDWDEEDDVVPPPAVRKDEPMSPVAVVRESSPRHIPHTPTLTFPRPHTLMPVYVVFFYVVWQILTRSDDGEILEHLPSGSPLFSQPSYEQRNAPAPAPQYQLPYALQQLPSALPPTAESPSTVRWVLAYLVYPVYIAITLIAIPLPFLLNALNLLVSIVATILYPITSTFRLLARTFVLAPLNVVRNFLYALYPVYVFVGGVVGAGAFLGVAFGWAGRVLLGLLLRPRSRRRKSTRSRSKRRAASAEEDSPQTRRHSLPPQTPTSAYASTFPSQLRSRPASTSFETSRSRPVSGSFETSRSRPTSGSYERRFVPIVDVIEIDDGEYLPYEQSHTTARQGVVLGVRRRGGRI